MVAQIINIGLKLIEIISLSMVLICWGLAIDFKSDGKFNVFSVKEMDWEEFKRRK